jgi:hypothetical protein
LIAPFLKHSGQLWKPILGWSLIAAGLTALGATQREWGLSISSETWALIVLSANLVNVSAFVWMIRRIRCPRCGERLFWRAISGKDHPAGLKWFSEFRTCPSCQHEPEPKPP